MGHAAGRARSLNQRAYGLHGKLSGIGRTRNGERARHAREPAGAGYDRVSFKELDDASAGIWYRLPGVLRHDGVASRCDENAPSEIAAVEHIHSIGERGGEASDVARLAGDDCVLANLRCGPG